MAKSKAPPKKQLSYRQFVQKVIKDRPYAREVHKLVSKARAGDEAAATKLKALVTLTDDDIEKCCLPKKTLSLLDCGVNKSLEAFRTNTTTLLLDFAAMV
jgi:hypothetical protein